MKTLASCVARIKFPRESLGGEDLFAVQQSPVTLDIQTERLDAARWIIHGTELTLRDETSDAWDMTDYLSRGYYLSLSRGAQAAPFFQEQIDHLVGVRGWPPFEFRPRHDRLSLFLLIGKLAHEDARRSLLASGAMLVIDFAIRGFAGDG